MKKKLKWVPPQVVSHKHKTEDGKTVEIEGDCSLRQPPRKFPDYYLPKGRRIYILFQDSNGDESSKRYCFWFDSKKKALEHRKHVLRNPEWAQVSRPIPFVQEYGWKDVKAALDARPKVKIPQCQLCLKNPDHKGECDWPKSCTAEIWHGAGHQTRSTCDVTGPHKQHSFRGEFFWSRRGTKKKPVCSGYFDQSPEEEK